MTFLLFEISCIKVKRLDQSQDYFHLVPKRFLEVGGNRVFGQSSKNLFEPFLCSSSSCSYFVSKRVLLYQSECVKCFLSPLYPNFFNRSTFSHGSSSDLQLIQRTLNLFLSLLLKECTCI